MTRTQTVIPQLRMTEAERSLRFYSEGLGFAEDWRHQFEPGLPLFVQLTRAGQTVFLSGHAGDGNVGGAVFFIVPDVDAVYRALPDWLALHVPPPADMPWGTREMAMMDPDGNRLRFATYADDENA